MASMVKQSFLDVISALEGITYVWPKTIYKNDKAKNSKLFQMVSIWNNNIELFENGNYTPTQTPCCYIEELPAPVTKFLGPADMRDFNIRIHIVDWQFDAGNGTTDRNVEVMDWRDLTKTALMYLKLTYGGKLQQTDEEQDYAHKGLYHYIIDFKAALLDFKGDYLDPDQTKVNELAPPEPSGEFPLDTTIEIVNEIE